MFIEWIDPAVDVVGSRMPEGSAAVARGTDVGRIHSVADLIVVLVTRQLASPGGGPPIRQAYAAVPLDSIYALTPLTSGKRIEL